MTIIQTIRRPVAALLVLTMTVLTTPANANLQDALDSMFMSNVTAPGAFASQSRGGLVGGSVVIRSPVRSINLFTFDPPRFDAGCGGIDMFGGSFSFINADQLVALFRQIAANAVGAAFMLAVKAINAQLGGIMEKFQDLIQHLNGLMKNTCEIANTLVKTASDAAGLTNAADQSAAASETKKGTFDSVISAWTKLFSSKGTSDSPTYKAAADGSCVRCGNLTWKALSDSGAGQLFGNPVTGESNVASANMLIMSLIGTSIGPSTESSGTNTDGSPKQPEGANFGPTITSWSQFRRGANGAPFKVYSCTDTSRMGCLLGDMKEVSNTTFNGLESYVNNMLLGSNDGTYTVGSGSIVDKLINCSGNGCDFTAQQKTFINIIRTPLLGILRSVQRSPAALPQIAVMLAPIITDEIEVVYANAANNAVQKAWYGSKIDIPPQVQDAIRSLNTELNWIRSKTQNQNERILAAKAFAESVTKNSGAIFNKF